MALILKYYKDDGKEYINGCKPRKIDLEKALKEIENLPTEEEYENNFIGFSKSLEDTVQFIRRERDNWLIDIPLFKDGIFHDSYIEEGLTTERVKEIVKKFFLNEDWTALLDLKQRIPIPKHKCPKCGRDADLIKTWTFSRPKKQIVGLFRCPSCGIYFRDQWLE